MTMNRTNSIRSILNYFMLEQDYPDSLCVCVCGVRVLANEAAVELMSEPEYREEFPANNLSQNKDTVASTIIGTKI
jgi:hypothetical protein